MVLNRSKGVYLILMEAANIVGDGGVFYLLIVIWGMSLGFLSLPFYVSGFFFSLYYTAL